MWLGQQRSPARRADLLPTRRPALPTRQFGTRGIAERMGGGGPTQPLPFAGAAPTAPDYAKATEPGSAQPGYGSPFEQYPIVQFGIPALDEMMRSLGFEPYWVAMAGDPRGGEWRWRAKHPGFDYDPDRVAEQYAQTRDVMEPELLRQLAGAEGALAGRGLSRSSLMGGAQTGLRGDFLKAMLTKRMALIQQERQRRWQSLIQAAGLATDMAQGLASGRFPQQQKEEDSGSEWWQAFGSVGGLFT